MCPIVRHYDTIGEVLITFTSPNKLLEWDYFCQVSTRALTSEWWVCYCNTLPFYRCRATLSVHNRTTGVSQGIAKLGRNITVHINQLTTNVTKRTIVTFVAPLIHPSGFHVFATLHTRFLFTKNVFFLWYTRLGSNQTSSVCQTRWLLPRSFYIAATNMIITNRIHWKHAKRVAMCICTCASFLHRMHPFCVIPDNG